jgi:hypothetical protein
MHAPVSRPTTTRRVPRARAVFPSIAVCALAAAAALTTASAAGHRGASAAAHFICSGANAARVPCRFSTPSGNVRCVWMPVPNNVACVRIATGRAFRLRPTGHAKAIRLKLARRGQILPRNQQLEFPESMSCHDTYLSMTCNQNFLAGSFRLAPHGSRAT